jgi:hypothetical protein
MNEYQRVLRINDKPTLPPDLSKPSKELDDYLSTLKGESEASQRKLIRYAKMTKTRQQNLVAEKKAVICKQDKTNEPTEGSFVIESIKGLCVVCDHCSHKWVHHSSNLGRQYFCQCPHCRRNTRLYKPIRG